MGEVRVVRLIDLLGPALRQFRTQRLQALLIAVAIALGVGVVVAVAALTEAGKDATAALNDSIMGRQITVRSAASRSGRRNDPFVAARQVGEVATEPVILEATDLRAAKEALPEVPYLYFGVMELLVSDGTTGRPEMWSAYRATADYFNAVGLQVLAGSLFTAADYEGDGQVVLVTPRLVEELGLAGEPVGQTVMFSQGGSLRIVGVVEELSGPFDAGDTLAYMPLTTELFRQDVNSQLQMVVADVDDLQAAQSAAEAFARGRWGDGVVVESLVGQFGSGTNTTLLLIAGFASLALLVAALNIMNLMLARVLRRQRDIGIMRTIGASRRVIGAQVLSEAVALGVLGGLLGLAAAFGLLAAYNSYMLALSVGLPVTEITTSMRWGSAGVGVGVAVAVSLIFGAYPAAVAARVRPVSALRGI